MRKLFMLLAITILAIASCVKDSTGDYVDPALDLSFAFSTRTDMVLSLTANDELGNPSAGVLFSVYTENPYLEDGEKNSLLNPIYAGYTESNGSASVSIPVPTDALKIYIVPEYAGYGDMQVIDRSESASVTLAGKTLTSPSSTKADEFVPRDRIDCGDNMRFYRYFVEGIDYTADYGEFITENNELISTELLSTDFKSLVNTWFPEKVTNYRNDICTDIIIGQDNTEVWVTYVGDGGYAAATGTLNSVLYYVYDSESSLPDITSNSSLQKYLQQDNGLTYAIIDGDPSHIACGTKVRLLYWNGEKYVKEFPAGKRIGFAFLYNGYKKNGNTRGFSLQTNNIKFSTPKLNPSNKAMAVTIWSQQYGCYLMGLENGGVDLDYNEMLLKVITSKPVSLTGTQTPPSQTQTSKEFHYEGTLAFEDLWPNKGDYDFNDFVTDYQYSFVKSGGNNNISEIKLTFRAKASGASNSNGFGIMLPVLKANIANIENGHLENNIFATIRVYENVNEAFGYVTGFVNTYPNQQYIASTPITISLKLTQPVAESELTYNGFNPFLFSTNNHGKEIHLVDYEPTPSADLTLFGTGDDKSNTSHGIYYRMDNSFPWALDIAKSGTTHWRYPIESATIDAAYLHYSSWVSDHKTSWFDWTIPGNADESLLYPYHE